jgi:putative hemolysin
MSSEILFLASLVLLSGIFSGSETALVSLSPSKVDELVSKKVRNAKLLKKMKNNPHRLLITVLIGNNIVNIFSAAYAAVVFTEYFGSSGVGIATGVMTFFILIFGEITPKSFCVQHAVGVSLYMAKLIYFLQLFLFPLVWSFEKIVFCVNRVFGAGNTTTVTEGELVAMLKIGAQEGSIEKQEKELIENVLEFNDIEAEEVMTPRVAIDAMDEEMTIEQAIDFVIHHSHTRIPIYCETIDNIVSIISIKKLLKFSQELKPSTKLKQLQLTSPLEIPFSKKINKLFREMQRKHVHIAIVIDEHGGTSGLVTMEDLLEEIVGEIVDEHDIDETPIEIIDSRTIITTGKTLVEDVNDFFRMKFSANERDTINTLVTEHLHRFPQEGETIEFPRGKIQVLEMGKNVIRKVKITKKGRNLRDRP